MNDDMELVRQYAARQSEQAFETLVARGPLIDVYLNGKKVLHVSDSTFAAGRIGLRLFGDPNYPCDATYFEADILLKSARLHYMRAKIKAKFFVT